MLLSGLGLRAGEVAGLGLDDLDWRAGQIIVAGKGARTERGPLPSDVGGAVADYLRHARPPTALDRRVLIRVKAPHCALTWCGVTQIVVAAGRRAGLGELGAHRLRHTAATQMLPRWRPAGRDRPGAPVTAGRGPPRSTRKWTGRRCGRSPGVGRRVRHDPAVQALDDYLAVRRALGYKLERPGQLLAQFVAYLDQAGVDTVTVTHALAWARLPEGGDTGWWAYRLSAVRGFACWLHSIDPAVEVPPADLLPSPATQGNPIPVLRR